MTAVPSAGDAGDRQPQTYMDEIISINDFDGTKLISSPRSLEACYELGITPEELMPRTLVSFARPKDDPQLVTKRAERFEARRLQLLEQVSNTRRKYIDSPRQQRSVLMRPASPVLGRSFKRSVSPVARSHHASNFGLPTDEVEDSTMIENERRRLERIQQKQLAEMQQMINWEIKQAELQAKHAEQMAQRKRHEEAMEREKTKRMREAEEARRQRELEKTQRQRDEVAAAKALAQRDYAEAKKRKQIEERNRKIWKQELMQREQERAQKAEAHKQQTLAILGELEAKGLKRMDEIARRDGHRKNKLERRRREKMAEMIERTNKNKERIAAVTSDRERLQQQQREAYAQRQAENEQRRLRLEEEFLARKEEQERIEAERKEAELAIREQQKYLEMERRERLLDAEREAEYRLQLRNDEKEAQRQQKHLEEVEKNHERMLVAQRMRETEELRQSQILTKSQAKGQRTQMMQEKRKQEMRARWMESRLRAESIQDALERKARRDEYHKSVLLSKLETDQARADAIKQQRNAILKQRKIVKQQADIQRKEILDSFYKMKITKKFDLQAVESVMGSTSRPRSAQGSPNKTVPKVPARPRTAPKTARRPKTPTKHPPSASAQCRQRFISRRISRHPVEKPSSKSAPLMELHESTPPSEPVTLTIEEQMESFRRRQNQELLRVLEEEQAAEEQREVILRQVRHAAERQRLEKIFGHERSQASERIMRMTEEHEIMFTQRLAELESGAHRKM